MSSYKYEDLKEISENLSWFKIFEKLPLIILIISALASFVLGIVFYDLFDAAIVVFWLVGAIASVINFAVAKILLSPTILKVYYLQAITSKLDGDSTIKQGTNANANPKIVAISNSAGATTKSIFTPKTATPKKSIPKWICPKCGERNREEAKYCINCFTNKPEKINKQSNDLPPWICPKCGEKNNYAAKNCINCFEPKP